MRKEQNFWAVLVWRRRPVKGKGDGLFPCEHPEERSGNACTEEGWAEDRAITEGDDDNVIGEQDEEDEEIEGLLVYESGEEDQGLDSIADDWESGYPG